MIATIKNLFLKMKERKALDIGEFAQRHRNYIVIVCDPKDDSIHVSYRGKVAAGRIRSADGLNHHVLKNMMKFSTFDREVDRFLGGLMEILKIPLDVGNTFYAIVEGFLFNISKKIYENKNT